jgi:hypothetical protein
MPPASSPARLAAKMRRDVGRNTRNPIGRAAAHPRNTTELSKPHVMEGTQAMRGNDAALEQNSASRLLHTLVAGLAGVLAAALFLGVFDGGLPRPVRAEVALAAPSAPGLCFHGPGGELLDFAPAGQGCR